MNEGHWDHGQYDEDPWCGHGTLTRRAGADAVEATKPLTARFAEIDALLHAMNNEAATRAQRVRQIDSLADLLSAPVQLCAPETGRSGPCLRLSDPGSVTSALRAVAPDLHLNIRTDPHSGIPAFLLFRVARSNYYEDYATLLEDLYRSPQFAIDDPRFVIARVYGRERWYLRLSPYRDAVGELLRADPAGRTPEDVQGGLCMSARVDAVLTHLAINAIAACWHDSQRVAARVADVMRIEGLVNAIELIYYANTVELQQLRQLDDLHIAVLTDHFNPLLGRFVVGARRISGQGLGRVRDHAKGAYKRLQAAFARLMRCEVAWGQAHVPMRLAFIVHANFKRLDTVAHLLRQDQTIRTETARLQREARVVADELLAIAARDTTD
jgi:hypothetical protein